MTDSKLIDEGIYRITPFDMLLVRQDKVRTKKQVMAKRNMERFCSVKANAISVDSHLKDCQPKSRKRVQVSFSDYLDYRKLSDGLITHYRQTPMQNHHRPEFLTPVMKIRNGNYRTFQRRVGGMITLDPYCSPPYLEVNKLVSPQAIDNYTIRNLSLLFNPPKLRYSTSKHRRLFNSILDYRPITNMKKGERSTSLLTEPHYPTIERPPTRNAIEVIQRHPKLSQQDWRRTPVTRTKKLVFSGQRMNEIQPWYNTPEEDDDW